MNTGLIYSMERMQPMDFSSVMRNSCQGYTLMNLDTRHIHPQQITYDTTIEEMNPLENNQTFKYTNNKTPDVAKMLREPPACMFSDELRPFHSGFGRSRFSFQAKFDMSQDPAMRSRPCFTSQQTRELEREFVSGQYITRKRRLELAFTLNLTEKQIKTWFQNRRVKERKTRKSDR